MNFHFAPQKQVILVCPKEEELMSSWVSGKSEFLFKDHPTAVLMCHDYLVEQNVYMSAYEKNKRRINVIPGSLEF